MSRRALALGAVALTVAGCGSGTSPSPRDELAAYVSRVEPIRLQVNRLLDRADPTLSALSDRRLPTAIAQRRLGRLERRFAADQRAAITAWRIALEVQAHHLGLRLPADLQAAGRGEIAPSPTES